MLKQPYEGIEIVILIPLNVSEQMFMISFKSYEKIEVMHVSATRRMPFKLHIFNLKGKNKTGQTNQLHLKA